MKTLIKTIAVCASLFICPNLINAQCEVLDGMGDPINQNNFPFNENLIPNPEFEDVISFGLGGEFECWESVNGSPDALDEELAENFCNEVIGTYNNSPDNTAILGVAGINEIQYEHTQCQLPVFLVPGTYNTNVWSRFCSFLSSTTSEFAIMLSTSEASSNEIYGEAAFGIDSPNVEIAFMQELTEENDEWAQYNQDFELCRDDLNILSILVIEPENGGTDYVVFDGVSLELIQENQIEYSIENIEDELCSDSTGSIDVTIPEAATIEWELPDGTFSNSEDLSNLSAGTYNATIEDSSCFYTSTVIEIEIEDNLEDCCFDPNAPVTHILDGENVDWEELWDFVVLGDVIVHDGGHLNIDQSNILFAKDVRIRVEQGGHLKIIDSFLDSNCDEQWGGIEVYGDENSPFTYDFQGVIEVEYSAIRNAECAILFGATNQNDQYVDESGGGFGYVFNSKFLNNERDIHALRYLDPTAGIKVRDTFFEIDENYFSTAEYPLRRVSLDNRMYFWFEDCHFINSIPELLLSQDHGFELTAIHAENSPFSLRSEDPDVINSEIIGFSYGTRSSGGSTNATYTIRDVRFENYRDVFFRNGFYSGVYENELYPLPQGFPNPVFPDWLEAQNYDNGIALIPGTYAIYYDGILNRGDIQENFIDMHELPLSSGIVARGTFNSMLPIYNNEITNAVSGLKFLDQNRLVFQQGIPGLNYECNDLVNNVIDVEINAQTNNLTQGVNANQGNEDDGSPRNTFDNTFISQNEIEEHVSNFITGSGHNYFRTNAAWEPEDLESNAISFDATFEIFECDSQVPENLVINGGGNEVESAKLELVSNYNSKKEEWELLVDGGNTETLTEEVINTEFADALELYYELMAKSPNLSEQVMLQAIDKEYDLPMVLLKQILTSNPQSAKSERIQKKLNNRLMPLPDYMRQEIMAGLQWVSQKEKLESQMHRIKKQYRLIEFAQISLILGDESIDNPVELIQEILDNSVFEEDIYETTMRLVTSKDYDTAIAALENEQMNVTLNTDHLDNLMDLVEIISMKSDLESNLLEFNFTTELILSDIARDIESPASSIAQTILERYGDHICFEEVNYPQVEFSERRFVSSGDNDSKMELISVYPNPAKDMLVIEKEGLPVTEKAIYTILDFSGKEVISTKVSDDNQQVIDVSGLPAGKYSLTLMDINELITSVEFIKL